MTLIQKKDWSEVSKDISILNPVLHKCMEEVTKTQKKSYVYEIEVPYGTELINRGQSAILQPKFLSSCSLSNQKGLTIETFLSDFSNRSDHPLSIIKSGMVEIFESNSYALLQRGALEYWFPLNVLKETELIGTFGAMDLITGFKYDKPHYSYSALSGNHCVYPILPRTLGAGKIEYKRKMSALCKELSLKHNPNDEMFRFFPDYLKKAYSTTGPSTKLLLIPEFWFNKSSHQNSNLRCFISSMAWIQLRDSAISNFKTAPVINQLKHEPGHHLISEMLIYLLGIYEGKRLALKPVDENCYLYSIYSELKEKLDGIYDPVILYCDFLQKGEWGLFPLFTFPTLNPLPPIYNAQDFLKKFEANVRSVFSEELLLNNLRFYYGDNGDYKTEIFSDKKIYTDLFLTRAILKIHRN